MMKLRTLWIGMAAAMLVAALGAAGTIAWQNREPHRYATINELNAALDAATKAVTSYRSVHTIDWHGLSQTHTTWETVLQSDGSGARSRTTFRSSITPAGDQEPVILVVTREGVWQSASGLPDSIRATLPPGKSWIAINPDTPSPLVTATLAAAVRQIRALPVFTPLFDNSYRIVDAAPERLDGIPTYRYTLRRDLAKAAEHATDPAVRKSLQDAGGRGENAVESKLWVDAEDHPTRITVEQNTTSGRSLKESRFSDWGKQFRIDPPPANTVYGG